MDTVQVGVVGTGFGRLVHVPGFRAVEGVQVCGLAGADPGKSAKVAAELGIPKAFASWQELVADPDIDAVSIATPPHMHCEIALAAIAEGKSVFCEKPLALDVSQALKMLSAALEAGVAHAVDFEFRAVPHWIWFKALLENGTVGRPRQVNVTWLLDGRAAPGLPWSWQYDMGCGGGTLGAFGSHFFDYIEWMLNPVATVSARLYTRVVERVTEGARQGAVVAEDTCSLLLELTDGTPVTASLSNVAPIGRGHWIEIYGERGTLVLGSSNRKDQVHGFTIWAGKLGGADLTERPLPAHLEAPYVYGDGRLAPFIELARRFVIAVRGGHQTSPSFREGLRAQALMEAARRSHRESGWVRVE